MNRRPYRVLLVEDHEAYALTLATILSSDPSIEVVGHASDGRAGIELALAERPDLVLMDVHMPELDGIEATRELALRLPETAVVMLSSSDLGHDVARARAAGAAAYLVKDVKIDVLLTTIADAVEAKASGEIAHEATRPRQPARQTALRFCL